MMLRVLPLLLLATCRSEAPAPAAAPEAAKAEAEPPRIVVTAERKDLVFTFVDPAGKFHDATQVADIPEESRSQVLVRDLSKSPDELRAHEFLYVADLRTPDDKGRYPCGVVSRRAFERTGSKEAASQAAAGAIARGEKLLVLYTTSWCGVCKRTKSFLKERGIAFLERDIEKDAGAEEELQAKAAAQGVRPQGVPVIDVAGELLMGFDPDALLAALDRQGLAAAP